MITRELPRNRYLEATGNPLLRTTAGDVFTASRTADYMTDLAARQMELAKAERRGQPARSLPMQMYDREGNRIGADDLSRIAGGPDQDIPGPRPEVERIAPETLNERYKDLGLDFDAPMTEDGAQILADAKKAEIIRNDIIARGPEGAAGGATVLAGGLAGMATDPLEVMTAIIPVVGVGRAASIIGRLGIVRGRAVIGATEGLVGAAATEPIVAIMSRQQQLDYTFNDALLNTVLGGMLGAGIGTTAGVLRKFRGQSVTPERVDVTPERVDTPEARTAAPERVTTEAPRVTQETPVATRTATETGEAAPAVRQAQAAETAAPAPAQRAGEMTIRMPPQEIVDAARAAVTREDEAAAARTALAQVVTGRTVDVEPAIASRRAEDVEEAADLLSAARTRGDARRLQQAQRLEPSQMRPNILGNREWDSAPQKWREEVLSRAGWDDEFPALTKERKSIAKDAWHKIDDTTRNRILDAQLGRVTPEEARGEKARVSAEQIAERRAQQERIKEVARRAQDPANDYSSDVEASREISDRLASTGDDWLSEDEAFLMAELDAMRARGELDEASDATIREADELVRRMQATGDVAKAYAACLAR